MSIANQRDLLPFFTWREFTQTITSTTGERFLTVDQDRVAFAVGFRTALTNTIIKPFSEYGGSDGWTLGMTGGYWLFKYEDYGPMVAEEWYIGPAGFGSVSIYGAELLYRPHRTSMREE